MLVRSPISMLCTSPRTTAVGPDGRVVADLHAADDDRRGVDEDPRAEHGRETSVGSDVHGPILPLVAGQRHCAAPTGYFRRRAPWHTKIGARPLLRPQSRCRHDNRRLRFACVLRDPHREHRARVARVARRASRPARSAARRARADLGFAGRAAGGNASPPLAHLVAGRPPERRGEQRRAARRYNACLPLLSA